LIKVSAVDDIDGTGQSQSFCAVALEDWELDKVVLPTIGGLYMNLSVTAVQAYSKVVNVTDASEERCEQWKHKSTHANDIESIRPKPTTANDLNQNLNGSSELSLSNASCLRSDLARIMTRPAALGAARAEL
jgi:hypothetical protein